MKLDIRLKAIEKEIGAGRSLTFEQLISPEFDYKGKPMETLDEIFEKLEVIDLPPYLSNDEMEILFEKGLWKYSINQTIEEMRRNI